MKDDAASWTRLAIIPIICLIWFLNLEVNFALAPLACGARAKGLLLLVSGISLVLIALAGFYSWKQRRRPLAVGEAGLSGFFFLVILAQSIPNLMMGGCE